MNIDIKTWKPTPANDFWAYFGRFQSFFAYPALAPFAVLSHCDATVENCRWWRAAFPMMGLPVSILGHSWIHRKWGSLVSPMSSPQWYVPALAHLVWFLSWDQPYMFLTAISHKLIEIFSVDRKENRLQAGRLHGPRVLVVGNGPSACQGEKYGEAIDRFDEVVRFNNFQCKVNGLEQWVGTKTTVHFTDGMLMPTYSEYHSPGATIVLSLFADRFMVAGSYIIMRAGADYQPGLTLRFMNDPETNWIDKENIERLKKALGLGYNKHPTSGMLGIDYFVNKPGVQLPVIIHGFDFFQGPHIHYYYKAEPWYERFNNHLGVQQHSPHKEKVYVEKLIAEGKVMFLKDMPKNG